MNPLPPDPTLYATKQTCAGNAAYLHAGWAVSLLCGLTLAVAANGSARAESRGELLYSSHCISCHSQEMHWRKKRVATDWSTLRYQVKRWQDASSLNWSEGDVEDVAGYLNETIYRYPRPPSRQARVGEKAKRSMERPSPAR